MLGREAVMRLERLVAQVCDLILKQALDKDGNRLIVDRLTVRETMNRYLAMDDEQINRFPVMFVERNMDLIVWKRESAVERMQTALVIRRIAVEVLVLEWMVG